MIDGDLKDGRPDWRMVLTLLRSDRAGATAIEYALIAGGLSIAIAASVSELGAVAVGLFEMVQGRF